VKVLRGEVIIPSNVGAKDIIKRLQKNIVANFMEEPALDQNPLKAELRQ